jgi:MerR family transcriptional regulator/heat shock protein HspR
MTEKTTRTFMISIAAELSGMHPQTLRMYERRGLIQPRRSARNTRLYSDEDVRRLRRIQELSSEGLNLAGISRVLALEDRARQAEKRVSELEAQLTELHNAHREEIAEQRRSMRAEIVPFTVVETALIPRQQRAGGHRERT